MGADQPTSSPASSCGTPTSRIAQPRDTPPTTDPPQTSHQDTQPSPLIKIPIQDQGPPRGLPQPSFYDNQFASPGSQDHLNTDLPDKHPRSRSPVVFVSTVDGEQRQPQDCEQRPVGGSDTDQSEGDAEFKDIKTVSDLGLGALILPQGPSLTPDQQSFESYLDAENINTEQPYEGEQIGECLGSTIRGSSVLQGVGSSFTAPQSETAWASQNDLTTYFDISEIADKLRESFVESKVSKKEFLPLDKLACIVNKDVVHKLLKFSLPNSSAEDLDVYSRQVCEADTPGTGRRKIFAILIMLERVASITDFIKADVRDSDLPLHFHWSKSGSRKYICTKVKGNISHPLSCFDGWNNPAVDTFKDRQLNMLAPYFVIPSERVFFYNNMDRDVVLPFIYCDEHNMNGGFGRVSKVKIHPAHHTFKSPKGHTEQDLFFAVKELKSTSWNDFQKEVEVLERFSGGNKPYKHLIQLLLTYRYEDSYYLVFPWADGNLKQFWKRNAKPTLCPKNAHWVIEQSLGLATGLRKVHHASSNSWPQGQDGKTLQVADEAAKDWGRHSDIKPENILWFKDESLLVISDFGLSRYHSVHSKSKDPHENLEGYSPTYRSPECDMRQQITQRYDIWSLGCVLLEFASWYILGYVETIEVFSQARMQDDISWTLRSLREDKFFNVVEDEGDRRAKVKQSVKMWIQRIHTDKQCPPFIHKLLDMVEHHCLIPESSGRWDCDKICQELKDIRDEFSANRSGASRDLSDEFRTLAKDGSKTPAGASIQPSEGTQVFGSSERFQSNQFSQVSVEQHDIFRDSVSDSLREIGSSSQQKAQGTSTDDAEQSESPLGARNQAQNSKEVGDAVHMTALATETAPDVGSRHQRRLRNLKVPTLLIDRINLDSQDSNEAGRSYSLDTTPPSPQTESVEQLRGPGSSNIVKNTESLDENNGSECAGRPITLLFEQTTLTAQPHTAAHAPDSHLLGPKRGRDEEDVAIAVPTNHEHLSNHLLLPSPSRLSGDLPTSNLTTDSGSHTTRDDHVDNDIQRHSKDNVHRLTNEEHRGESSKAKAGRFRRFWSKFRALRKRVCCW